MDMEALKEEIRLAMDGFGGSDIACAAACLALEDLECAQGKNWDWVQELLSNVVYGVRRRSCLTLPLPGLRP